MMPLYCDIFPLRIQTIIACFLFGNTRCHLYLNLDIGAYFILLGVILALSNSNILYAHNFYQNDNSILYTLIKQFEIEKNLVLKNQLSNNSSFSIHLEREDEFFHQLASIRDDVTEKSKFSNRYDATFSDVNLTTKALVSANMADEIL